MYWIHGWSDTTYSTLDGARNKALEWSRINPEYHYEIYGRVGLDQKVVGKAYNGRWLWPLAGKNGTIWSTKPT